MIIRQEKPEDYYAVFEIIEAAFQSEKNSDHQEQFLVEKLRKSIDFIPELSIVAELSSEIAGHILLSKIRIISPKSCIISLALAPIAVLPSFQNMGVGTALIKHAHQTAKDLGYESIAVLGNPEYYSKFGYKIASQFGIEFPFDVPKENCMIVELTEHPLRNFSGLIKYPKEFS